MLTKFKTRGLIALAWGERGFRHPEQQQTHAVTSPTTSGLKIRVTENPVYITTFRTPGRFAHAHVVAR